ncbi:MAG: aminopeptidase P family protein [Bacteroidia bacterium]|nr:MAG: aminopeptidase P family protein [Bacteroidia bacterium]
MFDKTTYTTRREKLKTLLQDGIVLLPGNVDVPMNYKSNTYRFRQDSNFLYFFGLDQQGLAAIIDLDDGSETIFGDDASLDDIIWMGPQPSLKSRAEAVGVAHAESLSQLSDRVADAHAKGRKIHFLPPYRAENMLLLEELLDIKPAEQKGKASVELIKAIVQLRSVKEPAEIIEIEKAMDVAWLMHNTAMKMARPGVYEHEIAGVVEGIALSGNGMLSFPLILSVHGETLHNHSHDNKLEGGQLLLMDGGAETAMHYATDHTRTMPVSGRFSPRQKDIYEIVFKAQVEAINAIRPGVTFKSIHMLAAEHLAGGLKELGLMKGDVKSAVEQGAHALFMPHGLGHMMGLDVHDMEDLGEDYVGYDDEVKRSEQFGTAFLRLGRKLQQGFVLTVEPGIYFIPALFEKWQQEKKFADFINYDKVKEYIGFGGIRIEDDILVTKEGYRVLGKPIPKTVADVEATMRAK